MADGAVPAPHGIIVYRETLEMPKAAIRIKRTSPSIWLNDLRRKTTMKKNTKLTKRFLALLMCLMLIVPCFAGAFADTEPSVPGAAESQDIENPSSDETGNEADGIDEGDEEEDDSIADGEGEDSNNIEETNPESEDEEDETEEPTAEGETEDETEEPTAEGETEDETEEPTAEGETEDETEEPAAEGETEDEPEEPTAEGETEDEPEEPTAEGETEDETEEPEEKTDEEKAQETGDLIELTLRVKTDVFEKPDVESEKLATLVKDTSVKYLEKEEDWALVRFDDGFGGEVSGYIHKSAFYKADRYLVWPEDELLEAEEPADEDAADVADAGELPAPANNADGNEDPDSEPAITIEEPAETITIVGNADIRVAANGLADIIATVEDGTLLPLLAFEDDWVKVLYEGQVGFIYKTNVAEFPNVSIEGKKVTIFSSRRVVMIAGEPVYLTSRLEGFEDCKEILYIWYVDKGNGFEKVEGANEDTYVFTADAETLSWGWQLEVLFR